MGLNDIVKILILFIIFIVFIIWLVYYLFSIKLSNRIKNTSISNKTSDKNSIFDDIIGWYNKEKNKLYGKVLKNNIDYNENKKTVSLFIDMIMSSFILIIVYLFLCLFYLTIPDVSTTLLVFMIGLFIPSIISYFNQYIRRKQIEKNLLKAITLINNGLSSGKSIRESVVATKDKLDGAIKEELSEVINDLEHGLSLDVSFARMQKRTGIKDIIYLTTTLSMLSRTGGNTVLMFDYLEKIFKTRTKLDQELNANVASSRLVFIIMSIVPVIVFAGMIMIYDNYLNLYFMSSLGILLLLLTVILYVVYIVVISKIMKIDRY